MDVAPLVSAFRYRYHVLDAYGTRLGGLARPAASIEEALRKAAADLKLTADPPSELRRRAAEINSETRSALRDAIARAENDLAIAITRYGTDIGAPDVGPHIEMRTTLDGIDRSYRAMDPEPHDFDGWYDQLDAQIGHMASLETLERELETTRNGGQKAVKLPDASPGRLKWFLVAMVLAALAALGIAVFTTMNLGNVAATLPQPGPEAPRVVRTVPIIVTPPPEAVVTQPCRTLEVEIAAEGASLLDAPLGGQPIVRLEPGEKVQVKQVIDMPSGRLIEVDVPARTAHGFIGEREARLPVMTWSCN
ncbi:hypothetical protein E8L99_03240 [Phreatobacter aquaticus]|uniref:Uncharacterized protein n=1 Tax=Phreatobacter aquaticus TaxID=2570229 RepID=A0A4D7QCH1_9HYPH|nr:hypothetical protein [Phreatobacter aquaticus]QCK84868.1 hypothetical protein E8L99_03240 [Phreatobacter aquaticus]